ncbi:SDR family NAD(P)-dependent oxidoreductase [Microbacterium sediminicola]|uniref:3beta-hydroxysteroid 3-dehydrogenase n=1 Tax=Microbacterium sediminicola TaxID=415210 RepID=A0ABP4UAL1_9MICO
MASARWNPSTLPDLRDQSFLVTGSNAGLGYFASEQLARAGAHVILSGRNPRRLSSARSTLISRVPGADVESLMIDTSKAGSIRSAAATLRTRGPLDGVLLNAGIVHPPKERKTTTDGDELVLATNALGHYALAGELLVTLAKSAGRMVWLGSVSTVISPYDPVDPELTENYTPWRAYVQSKVVTTALGLEADRRLRDRGVPVDSVVVHPGYAIGGRTPALPGVNQPTHLTRFIGSLQTPIAESKEIAARVLVRALIDSGIPGGQFWGPRYTLRGDPRRVRVPRINRNIERNARIWEECEKLTRMRWPFGPASTY